MNMWSLICGDTMVRQRSLTWPLILYTGHIVSMTLMTPTFAYTKRKQRPGGTSLTLESA